MAESVTCLLLSCEHGGNLVPEEWQHLFHGNEGILNTHRGYDIGIAAFARLLATELKAPLHLAEVTRLLVELNRSPGHPQLFSEFSRGLGRKERKYILQEYYHPYRAQVARDIERLLRLYPRVCHLSLHSFTPVLAGKIRSADIGLLYDPQRPLEKNFCRRWRENILHVDGELTVRRNYPYRGSMDGFVTRLRRHFPSEAYLGLELELNQRWPLRGRDAWQRLQQVLSSTLQQTLH